ncbi:hypothetical protein MRX96_032659 [Rhipicephalus microplus]
MGRGSGGSRNRRARFFSPEKVRTISRVSADASPSPFTVFSSLVASARHSALRPRATVEKAGTHEGRAGDERCCRRSTAGSICAQGQEESGEREDGVSPGKRSAKIPAERVPMARSSFGSSSRVEGAILGKQRRHFSRPKLQPARRPVR